MWTLPAPPTASELKGGLFGTEYAGLIQAIKEAESEADRRFAELPFTIFLLGYNYCLEPADYERLLAFAPESPELTEWQLTLERIAQEHVRSFDAVAGNTLDNRPLQPAPGRFTRLWLWLRNHVIFGWHRPAIPERD
jgi:hypothetical protein